MTNDYLEKIYKTYYQPLFLYAFSLCKNVDDASDLVSSAFVKAFLSYREGNIKTWLYTVLKNEYYNLYKKRKRIINHDINLSIDSGDIVNEFIKEEQVRWLYNQIYSLNHLEREIMLLSLQEELSDKDIARITNTSINNVRVIKHRVKQKLISLSKKGELL